MSSPQSSHSFSTEAATDANEPKRKQFKKTKDNSYNEGKENLKERPYDFYKFAEKTAEAIKDESICRSGLSKDNHSIPPKWLNKRPKLTYSTLCKLAIQVISAHILTRFRVASVPEAS